MSKARNLIGLIEKTKKKKQEKDLAVQCPECNVEMKIKKFDDPSSHGKYERLVCPKCGEQAPTSRQSWKLKEEKGPMFTVLIDLGNEVFANNPGVEIARILRELAKEIEDGKPEAVTMLCDMNENVVGRAFFE